MIGRTTTIALLTTATLGTAACGNDDKNASTAPQPAVTTTAAATPAPTATARSEALPRSISKNLERKPTIPRPTGTPPAKLVVKDIVRGHGRSAKQGDNVTVQYVGVSYSTGEQFDASWDAGTPFTFQLGTPGIIAGWNEGVAGMKAGGRRELVIPPALAYGTQGRPGIAPNETLVFVIDLLSID